MLKEFAVRFLLVVVPSCGVLWAIAFAAGDLRTARGLTNQMDMTLILLGVMLVLFAVVYIGARLIEFGSKRSQPDA